MQKLLPDWVQSGAFALQLHNSPELSFAVTFGEKSYVLFVWEVRR